MHARARTLVVRTLAVLSVVLALLASGCDQCGGAARGPTIAKLTLVRGPSVKRDWADKLHQWQPAQPGAELSLGDGAQTDAQTTAELTFINGAVLALQPASTVRLLADRGASDTALDIETGSARLRVGQRGLALRTHVGIATIAPDSEVLLTRSGEALGFAVAFGDVSFRDADAKLIELRAGDSMNIGIGMAVLDVRRNPRPAEPDEPEGPAIAEPFSLQVTRGGVRVSEPDGKPRMLGRGRHELAPGAQLRLPAGSEAILIRAGERARLRGVGDFVLGEGGTLLEVRRGSAVMEADGPDVQFTVPEGTLRAHGDAEGTRATVSIGPSDGKVSVAQGRVTTTLAGATDELSAGSERTWSHGALAVAPGPAFHNMLARAGESFVVHAPEAPVAVGFDIGKCPGEGVLDLVGGRQQSRGTGTANLLFAPGIRAYTLRCIGPRGLGNIVARGSVHVLVDPGTRKLPPRAPTSQVDADGRSYTIYYQNQLPEVAVRWPNPPRQAKYALELDGTSIPLSAPEHLFTSGELRDGAHTLSFQAEGRRSRTTTVIVRFDNAAPKASLGAPANRGFSPGDLVEVEGVALPGWRVSVPGGTVQSGAADRFAGQVQTSQEQPDIAVRLSHPRLGTHYYLRRATDSR